MVGDVAAAKDAVELPPTIPREVQLSSPEIFSLRGVALAAQRKLYWARAAQIGMVSGAITSVYKAADLMGGSKWGAATYVIATGITAGALKLWVKAAQLRSEAGVLMAQLSDTAVKAMRTGDKSLQREVFRRLNDINDRSLVTRRERARAIVGSILAAIHSPDNDRGVHFRAIEHQASDWLKSKKMRKHDLQDMRAEFDEMDDKDLNRAFRYIPKSPLRGPLTGINKQHHPGPDR